MNHDLSSTQFLQTSRIYDCLRRVSTTRIWVRFPELNRLSECFRKLKSRLGENADDDYWVMFNWRIRRYQFLLSCVPLPPNHASLGGSATLGVLRDRLLGCSQSYPAHTDRVNDVVTAFESVFQNEANYLLQGVIDQTIENDSGTILVIRQGQFVGVVQQDILLNAATNKMRVMSPKQISTSECCRNIVIFGPRRWYPEYMFTAPRGESVYLTCYDSLSDRWSSQHVFLRAAHVYTKREISTEQNVLDTRGPDKEATDDDDIIAEIDLSQLAVHFAQSRDDSSEGEQVDAILLFLEGDAAVFVDASEDSKTLTINLDLDPSLETAVGNRSRFRRIPNVNINIGDCVILRTKGGGDYLRPVADRFLGQNAQKARACQQEWKYRLSALVRADGALATSIALLDRGSIRADENNLRTWISNGNIGPQNFRDFEAIMELIGSGEHIAEYWSNAQLIRSAHMRAGMYIRRSLLKVVAAADLSTLGLTGQMEFELPGTAAGSLTAFRVRSVSEKRFKIASSRIAEPFEVFEMLETS